MQNTKSLNPAVALHGDVIAHMFGNLKIFAGADEIDAYSRFLREVGMPELGYGQLLWLVRVVLLVCVTLHRCSTPESVAAESSMRHRAERIDGQ